MNSETVIQISNEELEPLVEQARNYLEQARYKQAIRQLDQILEHNLNLIQQLQLRAQRALAYALWRKAEPAIEEASAILSSLRVDTHELPLEDIDWEYEKAEDVGHLSFLADIFQLRGTLYRVRRNARRAVEDLTLSIYMTREQARNSVNYLHRAAALIEMGECLERALADLEKVRETQPDLICAYFEWEDCNGRFILHENQIVFAAEDTEHKLSPDRVKLRARRIDPAWFRLRELLEIL